MIRLQTERFIIRDLFSTDLENIHQLHSLPETDEFNTLGIPETIQTTERILNAWLKKQTHFPRTSYVLNVELSDSKTFIGLIALNLGNPNFKVAEMWYKIHASTLREGYVDEALRMLFEFAFNFLNLHRIESDCAVFNLESIRILEKLGMVREGKKRQFLPINDRWMDSYMYAILSEDFEFGSLSSPPSLTT
ncbi:MAG: GNAT family N-acetyltransferase [Chitinophagaceae bacterium]|nr:GNAT family N-acetyltransferase [Chitinophagaceae bacterium]